MAEWTTETLKTYFDAVLAERDKQVIAALEANERRLNGMNEFREQLNTQARDFMSKSEAELQIAALRESSAIIYANVARIETVTAERDKATSNALVLNDKRLDTMNEFRAALADQQHTFLGKSEFEVRHEQMSGRDDGQDKRLNDLDKRIAEFTVFSATRQRTTSLYISIASVLAAIGAVVALGVFH